MLKTTLTPRQAVLHERTIERHLVRRVEAAGGLALKFKSPQRRGVPDRVVILPGGVVWFVELKTAKGPVNGAQARQHAQLRQRGARVVVLRSIEMVDAWCDAQLACLSTFAGLE